MAGNSGNAISFVGGLNEGYVKGLDLKRQREKEARDEERQAMQDARYERQDAREEANQAMRQQEHGLTMQEKGLSLKAAQDKIAREEKERSQEQYRASFDRRLWPLIQEDQKKGIRPDFQGALAEIERANNEDPAFDDGLVTEFAKGPDGKITIDKDGKASVRIVDKASGKQVGDWKSITAQDAIVSARNRLMSPDEYNKMTRESADRQLKLQEDEDRRKKDVRDYGSKLRLQTDETIRREETLAKKGLGSKGGSANGATVMQRDLEYLKSWFPGKSEDEIYKMYRTGQTPSRAKMVSDMTGFIMRNEYGVKAEEAKARAEALFPEAPDVKKPANQLKDVATEFGILE